jgi:hypothetical protein
MIADLERCTLTRADGRLVVRDADGCVAISPVGRGWIDVFGGVFSPCEIAALDAFAARLSYDSRCSFCEHDEPHTQERHEQSIADDGRECCSDCVDGPILDDAGREIGQHVCDRETCPQGCHRRGQ